MLINVADVRAKAVGKDYVPLVTFQRAICNINAFAVVNNVIIKLVGE